MSFAKRLAHVSIACGLALTCATAVLASGTQGAPADPLVPTAIEEALIEHACGGLRPAGTLENAPYLECRNRQLLSLRTDFGRDLRRLSNAERRTIDSACSGLRVSRGQDAYVECLTTRLASLRGHGNRPAPEAAAGAALPSPVAPPVASPPSGRSSSGLSAIGIGVALVAVVVAAAGGAYVTINARRRLGACRTCGVKLIEPGDLCQACRREAAETLRRGSAERAEQARAGEEEQRRQAAREAEHQQQARDDEARQRLREEAQKEHARQEGARAELQRDEETRQQRQIDVVATLDEDDPYVLLGLPQGASAADVEAAYQSVRSKFDLDLVAGMGVELQEHLKRKAEAVEQAYQTLTARRNQ